MDKYEETKRILNDMASVKMAMNSHKGDIENKAAITIMELMYKEVDELRQAVNADAGIYETLQEIADVQNFLVALAHKQIQQYRGRK